MASTFRRIRDALFWLHLSAGILAGVAATTTMSGRSAAAAVLPTFPYQIERAAGPIQKQDTPVIRFDIPPGSLGEALTAFESATGLKVRRTGLAESLGGLASPGVSGLLTVDQALRELLAGTGVEHRFEDGRTVVLELRIAETLDVVSTPMPAAPTAPEYTEPLRDIPQTLAVIPQALIEEQGATTLRDVLRNVSGISIQAGEGGGGLPGDNLTIRGFASRNDIFVDGVRDFGAYTRDPFNLEQVEIAKGPASLYSGRGSTGGSLNLVSKTPYLSATRSATLAAGSDDFRRATVDLNQPFAAGPAGPEGSAFRLNAMWNHADMPGRDAVENERWGVAPSFAFGLGTPTRVTLGYSHLAQDNVPDYGIPWVPATNIPLARYADQPAPVSFDNFYGLTGRDFEKTETGLATAVVEHAFGDATGDATTLRNLVRHGRSTRDSVITAPRFVSNDSTAINRQIQSRDLTDTILAYQGDLTTRFEAGGVQHALVAGVEISREDSKNFLRTGPAAPPADLYDPDPAAPWDGPITRTGAFTDSTARTLAAHASDTVKLGEHWEVTGGLRWDRFDIDFKSAAADGTVTPFERTDSVVSWRAGIVNKPVPNASLYLSAGTSFNPSSDGNTGLSLTTATVDLEPERSRTAEAGVKWDLRSERLSLSAAVFQTEKTNARTPGVLPGDPPTVLQGEQRVRGFELGLSGRITDRWSATLAYTFLDSAVVESNTPAEVGKRLGNTPESSASLWTTCRPWRGLELGAGAQYVGDRFNNNTETRVAPDYLLFDAMAAFDIGRSLTLRVGINNLTDERYIDRVGGGHFIPGAARSFSVSTGLKF